MMRLKVKLSLGSINNYFNSYYVETLTLSSLSFSLSQLGLKFQDLPVKLLSRLQSLERLDLSGNRLQDLPKKLELPALRYLDLSDNQMEDVTTLESLSSLEELKLDDNLYITVRTWFWLLLIVHSLGGFFLVE